VADFDPKRVMVDDVIFHRAFRLNERDFVEAYTEYVRSLGEYGALALDPERFAERNRIIIVP
jgi:hypothetical protein